MKNELLGMEVHTYNLSMWEAETELPGFPGQPGLQHELLLQIKKE